MLPEHASTTPVSARALLAMHDGAAIALVYTLPREHRYWLPSDWQLTHVNATVAVRRQSGAGLKV